ncbi:MAG: hypothetical protein PSV46_08905 [Reyranella sp.]|nr:hypothetical protein [Reyranella sp.]
MGVIKLDGLSFEQPAAEPWPPFLDNGDEHTIRVDEMFARQLDNEFSAGVRGLLHDPETGISAQRGEAALEAIAGALPALNELKERTLAEAMGPRQRSILEPLIETRLDWAAGTLGQLAQRATVEVDDQSVAERITGLNRDAATSWQDPAYLRRLGRTAVEELRYQGERRGWDEVETEARARGGLSDLYAGAVEAAMGSDLDRAARLYDHAREVIAPERQTALDRGFVDAREGALLREIDGALAALPLDPKKPPEAQVFAARTEGLIPDDASPEMRTRIGQVAAHAQRRAERQWQNQQAEAGVAALDWLRRNPDASLLRLPWEVRDWLAPDQWDGLVDAATNGWVRTDPAVYERLDRQAVYAPKQFAGIDLDRHRLALGDDDYARLATAQQARAEGRIDPAQIRWAHTRVGLDRAIDAIGIDTDGPEAIAARAEARDRFDGFEAIEGRAPNGEDIDGIVDGIAGRFTPDGGDSFDPAYVIPAGGIRPRGSGSSGLPQSAQARVFTYRSHSDFLRRIEPNNPLLATISGRNAAPDQIVVDRMVAEVQAAVSRRIDRLVGSPDNYIGTAGTKPTIREIPGGRSAANELFDKLSFGGTRFTPRTGDYSRDGVIVRLPGNGVIVGFRINAQNQPTVDIYHNGIQLKLHYVK